MGGGGAAPLPRADLEALAMAARIVAGTVDACGRGRQLGPAGARGVPPVTHPSPLPAIGSIRAVHGVTVSADLPGIVTRIAFDSGSLVHQGDVLVQLDTRQEQAQLAAADAQRALKERNLARTKQLRADGIISQ